MPETGQETATAGRRSLRFRMYSVVAVCAAPALIVSVVALIALGTVNASVVALNQRSVEPLALLGDLRDMEGDTRVEVWQYVAAAPADRADLAKQMHETDGQADADILAYVDGHGSATDAAGLLMTTFVADLGAWRTVRDRAVKPAADRNDLPAAYAVMGDQLAAANEAMAAPLDDLYGLETTNAAASATAADVAYRSARLSILLIAGIGLVLAVAAGFMITRRILLTVGRIAQVIAVDEPDSRVGATGDSTEIGAMGRALDRMLDAMARQRAELRVEQDRSEAQMRAASVRQRLGEREVRLRAQRLVDTSSTLVLTELQDVLRQADTVRQASKVIEQRATAAEAKTRSVVEYAHGAERMVAAVAESLQRVDGITGIIAGVAVQTNLLALNATIEASRAGDAGKGFAVVANAVKGLAAGTKSSTEDITNTVAALRLDSAQMSDSIAAMTEGVDGINTAITKVTGVAAEQLGSVELLDRCVNEAVERIGAMSQLSSQLERRRHERVDVAGAVVMRVGGRTIGGRLQDLSLSGMLCVAAVAPANGTRVEADVNLGGTTFTLQAVVMRTIPGEGGEQVGLEFVDLQPGQVQGIRAFLAALLDGTESHGARA
jgi:methyl-accepting chemotaxis protein